MKNQFLAILLFATVLAACNSNPATTETDQENATDLFTKVYTAANIEMQTFSIDADKATMLGGKHGTMIWIPSNGFVDSLGNPATGKVEIQLQEALQPIDWVMGNLTTVYQNQALESGGMIYLNARTAANRNLSIREGQSLTVIVPTDSAFGGMSMFEGRKDSNEIVWENPVMLLAPDPNGDATEGGGDIIEGGRASTNVSVISARTVGKDTIYSHPREILDKAWEIVFAGDGLKITKDSFLMIDQQRIELRKVAPIDFTDENYEAPKGTNHHQEDRQTSYVFALKKLGWANIDRFLNDPRRQVVDLVTTIANHTEFKFVYVTMVTQNSYLPGYQKKDLGYGFSHSDNHPQELPVGESATIIATAHKNGKTYYALQKITISKKANVTLQLAETTPEQLKADLLQNI